MKTFSDLIVCEHCDSVYRRQPLPPGAAARCGRCGAILRRAGLDLDRWLALTLAAAIAFVIANVCPVVRISMQGIPNEATLWKSAAALAQGPIACVAVPLALSIIVVPFLQIGLLAWVLAHARAGRRAPGFAPAMRLLVLLRPWSMVEVCLLGILVAVAKLSHLLQVAPGPGLWATAGLMALVTLIANRDVQRLWDLTEPGSNPSGTEA
ncbi:MAG: paraquat-inducible protein A [Candidatus Accumulibacter sp.]|jgi:paraquat-inducible protein A|nr:paraquat-inducible protein A [Accumulibacter sp.]